MSYSRWNWRFSNEACECGTPAIKSWVDTPTSDLFGNCEKCASAWYIFWAERGRDGEDVLEVWSNRVEDGAECQITLDFARYILDPETREVGLATIPGAHIQTDRLIDAIERWVVDMEKEKKAS